MTGTYRNTIEQIGKKWGMAEKQQWFAQQTIKRSYQEDVVNQISALSACFDIVQYGTLAITPERYPLLALKNKHWQERKKTVLVTGGVHGYETSGVLGALRFLHDEADQQASRYSELFNILVVPCVSPWAYETINRWNNHAVDPNRSFYENSPATESAALISLIKSLSVNIFVHIDLHETTDTDNLIFRPALAARDAITQTNWNIPDGFYLVADSLKPQANFQRAIIDAVANVTHIAPADTHGQLIGVQTEQFGVINYASKALGLCMGLTDAPYVTTTEVYPDSPKADENICIAAQLAAINGALQYIIGIENS